MILTSGTVEVSFTSVIRGTLAGRRASQAKIHAESRPFVGVKEDGPTTPPSHIRTNPTKVDLDDTAPPRSPVTHRRNDDHHFNTQVAGSSPTANVEDLVPHQFQTRKKELRQLFLESRTSLTPSPKKTSQTDSPNTSAVIKRLVSRCCMLQKIKNHFEECVRNSEREWESAIGTEHLPWASEHIMVEFRSEGHPRLTQFSDMLNELVTVENEVVNLLEEVIEHVCICIRRYSKRYNGQCHDNLTSKQFFRRVLNSASFKNSLNSKLAHNEEAFESFGRNPRIQPTEYSEDLEFCPSSFEEEELLLSGKLQLDLRRKLVESCRNIMEEIASCKHPLMSMRNSETLENMMTQMESVMDRHCRILRQMRAVQSGEDIDQAGQTSSSSPSGDHMFEMDDEDDHAKIHERQEREELEEEKYMNRFFTSSNKFKR
jgi:hypothetical protein